MSAKRYLLVRLGFSIKIPLVLLLFSFLSACIHRVSMEGVGDVVSESGRRDCSFAERACEKTIIGSYQESYTAVPGPGYSFDKWLNCQIEEGNVCSFDVPAESVIPHWGKRYSSTALFREHTQRVSVSSFGYQAAGEDCFSRDAAISDDGRYVVFASDATNLGGRTDSFIDIFVHDRQNKTTSALGKRGFGIPSSGSSYRPEISANGRYVVFTSESSYFLADGGSTERGDRYLYLHDLQSDALDDDTLLITQPGVFSLADARPDDANVGSAKRVRLYDVSADGSHVVFTATQADSESSQIFLFELGSNEILRVSEALEGRVPGNGDSFTPMISADGQTVVFASDASNLVDGDDNGLTDIYRYDVANGLLSRISNIHGEFPVREARKPSLSADGNRVAYIRPVSQFNGQDQTTRNEMVIYDRLDEAHTALQSSDVAPEFSLDPDDGWALPYVTIETLSMTSDGQSVIFNLNTNDSFSNYTAAYTFSRRSFVYDLAASELTPLEVISGGGSSIQDTSYDGRFVALASNNSRLVYGDTNNSQGCTTFLPDPRPHPSDFDVGTDVFVLDRQAL